MPALTVRLFGPPQITRDDQPVAVDTRKALALLAYLADQAQPVARSTLAALLWPDYPADRAQANLRRTLWSLNQALADGCVEAEQDRVALRRGGDLWIDLWRLHDLLAACRRHDHAGEAGCAECCARLEAAAELMRAEFLAGFSLTDSAEFDDWHALQAVTYRQHGMDVLRRLVQGKLAAGTPAQALPWAQRWAALDPLDEPAQRQLMLLYAWTDQAAAALRQYRELERRLEQELGVPPDAETVALFEAIKAKRVPLPPAMPGPAASAPVAAAPTVDGQPTPLPVMPLPALPSPEEPSPFVAREIELARLATTLATMIDGRAQFALVVGEAGAGKTALLQAFVRYAQEAYPDLIVVGGACNAYTGAGDPYLPFREVLEMLAGNLDLAAQFAPLTHDHARRLWQALPHTAAALAGVGADLINTFVGGQELLARAQRQAATGAPWYAELARQTAARPSALVDVTVQQANLFEQVAQVLRQVAETAPLLIILDDVQWADSGSINLLFHLSRRLAGHRILVAAAYRPTDVALGRDGARHPLEPVLHEIRRVYGDITVDLSQTQDRGLVDDLIDQEPNHLDEAFRATLFRQTGGHALFTVELLRGLKERGDLRRDDAGCWVSRPGLNWHALPARIDAVIGERIARLPDDCQELLRVASIEGEEFTAEIAARVLGMNEREVVRILGERLDREHALVRALGLQQIGGRRLSRYRFRHYLIQRYLYQSLDEPARAYLGEEVGTLLEQIYAEHTVEIAPQLARLFTDAGLTETAIPYFRQAGDRALRLSAHAEAIDHYTRALALVRQLPETPARLGQAFALESILTAPMQLTMGFSAPQVVAAFDHALDLGRRLGNPPEIVPLLGRAAHQAASLAEYARGLELADETLALALRAEQDDLLLEAHTAQGICRFYLGDFTQAQSELDQALAFYAYDRHFRLTYLYGQDPGVHAGLYAALNLWQLGYPDQAYAAMAEALALAERTGHPHTIGFAQSFAALLYSFANDLPRAEAAGAASVAVCAHHGFPQFLALSHSIHGATLARLGDPEAGFDEFVRGLEIAMKVHITVLFTYMLGLHAEILQRWGQPDDALVSVATAQSLIATTGEGVNVAGLHRLRAELLLAQGEPWTAARAEYEAGLAAARRLQARSQELQAAISYCRMARQYGPPGDQAAARAALQSVYAWFTEGFGLPDLQAAAALLAAEAG